MFFVPSSEKFTESEIKACKRIGESMGYKFDEETIDTMLNLLKTHISADELVQLLLDTRNEINKNN